MRLHPSGPSKCLFPNCRINPHLRGFIAMTNKLPTIPAGPRSIANQPGPIEWPRWMQDALSSPPVPTAPVEITRENEPHTVDRSSVRILSRVGPR